jgi:S-layer protein
MASASSYSTLVQELYVAYFGRPADYFGLQNFEAALASANAPTTISALVASYSTNTAVKSLIDSFGTSAESAALYGSGSTESFVTAIFENLLNRAPAVAGLSFWVNAINSGSVTKGDAALAIAAGAQSNTTAQGQIDATTIANKLAVAANFTAALAASSDDIVAYSGSTAAAAARALIAEVTNTTNPTTFQPTVAQTLTTIVNGHVGNTYTLTTGTDTIVGGPGNDVFNATLGGTSATLNPFDSITGGTLVNTLNITDFGVGGVMTIPSSAKISGMTVLNVNSLEAVQDDFSAMSGLTSVTIKTSTGTDNVTVGAAAALVVNDTSGGVNTTGGTTVAVTTDASHWITIDGGSATTSATLNGGNTGWVQDANYGTSKANTIASVSINGMYGSTTIESNAIASVNVVGTKAGGTGVVIDNSTAGAQVLALTLNGANHGYFTDDTATTVNVTSTGADSANIYLEATSATALTFDLVNGLGFTNYGPLASYAGPYAPSVKSVTITGAGWFYADFSADNTSSTTAINAAATINASASTGNLTVTLATGQSFTGGSGQDIITILGTQTGTIAAGSATNNEIVLQGISGASTATIASLSHFSILGTAGSTTGVFDMSKASGYNAFDVQGAGGNVTFTNAATGSSLSVDNNDPTNLNIYTLQTVDTTGANDSVTLNIGSYSNTGITVAQVTLEDSQFVGTGTVNLVSNCLTGAHTNTLTKLGDNNPVTLNLTGDAGLAINTAIADVSTSVTINNGLSAVNTSSVWIAGLTDNYLSTLTFSGAQGTWFGTLTSTSTSLTVTDNDAAAVHINTVADSALTTAAFTNSVNTKAAIFDVVNGLNDLNLATLNLNGNVQIGVSSDSVTSGITVAGATDNAAVYFNASGITASGKTDSITLGNGSDSVTLSGVAVAGSTQTIVLGSGTTDWVNTSSLGTVNVTVSGSTASTDHITANSASTVHITAGNGTDTISATATGASITVVAGTGSNSVTIGAGTSGTISFGAHTGTDSVTLGASGTSLTAIEKISGLNDSTSSTDTITFSDANNLTGFTQVTAGSVNASGGNTTLLSSWVAAADGATGSAVATLGATPGLAHGVTWFVFQGNTYILESVAGAAADAGTMVAANTLVELVGTGYTFAHTTGTGGHLALLG